MATPRLVSLVALPEAAASTLLGIFDVMNAFNVAGLGLPDAPFRVEIAGEAAGTLRLTGGVPVEVLRPVDALESSDIVIVPSVVVPAGGWEKGRYARLVRWAGRMHEQGALLCSACSGIFLLAETGLFDGKDATVHYAYARLFSRAYPAVRIGTCLPMRRRRCRASARQREADVPREIELNFGALAGL